MAGFEDIIGANLGGMFGAVDLVGTQFAGDHDMRALMGGYAGYPIVGADDASAAIDANKNAMLRQIAAQQAMAVVPRPVTKGRNYFMGFGQTSVTTLATAVIITQPQVPFKPRRLVVPSDIAGAFGINDLKIGKNSQLATSAQVPARTFTEFAVGTDLGLDTAQISQQITISVTNNSGVTVIFNATLIGPAVE